jgi:hypothetical protein
MSTLGWAGCADHFTPWLAFLLGFARLLVNMNDAEAAGSRILGRIIAIREQSQ